MNLDYETIRAEVERIVGFGPEIQVYGDPALTGKVKKVFEFANEEAANLNHNYVGTEHLLLALLRQTDGVAAQVLENLNVNLKEVRKEVLKELETFNLQLPPMGLHSSSAYSIRSKRRSAQQDAVAPQQQPSRMIKCPLFALMATI